MEMGDLVWKTAKTVVVLVLVMAIDHVSLRVEPSEEQEEQEEEEWQ